MSDTKGGRPQGLSYEESKAKAWRCYCATYKGVNDNLDGP